MPVHTLTGRQVELPSYQLLKNGKPWAESGLQRRIGTPVQVSDETLGQPIQVVQATPHASQTASAFEFLPKFAISIPDPGGLL